MGSRGNGRGNAEGSSAEGGRKTFAEKAAENPFVPIGMAGGGLAVMLSLLGYRRKDPNMKPSVYLIHTRMAAQGIVIGSCVCAMTWQLYNNHIKPALAGKKG